MNDEVRINRLHFIVHRSYFIVCSRLHFTITVIFFAPQGDLMVMV
jgi:hypothetical protein